MSGVQILGFVGDNAANNDTLVAELANLLPAFGGKKVRVRCFAHILNLVVKVRSLVSSNCSCANNNTM
jgi:ABC-type cobalamin transport system ATPase subunit